MHSGYHPLQDRPLRIVLAWGRKVVEEIPQELELITWAMIINGFGICYMLNVCVDCLVISDVICYMTYSESEGTYDVE